MQRHSGMFQQGQSGNPSGRPKADKTIRDIARVYTQEAVEVLLAIVRNERAPSAARVQACSAILDRGWGKPVQCNENRNEVISASLSDFLNELQRVESEKLVLDL